ncbi:uncharacterized protein LOC144099452 isoform X4 [Amblyomma americanum]
MLRFTTRLQEDIGVYERVLLHTTAIMHAEIVTGARINPKVELEEGRGCRLDPIAFLSLKENSYQENLKALDSVKFTRQPGYQDQHLDLGCGPANFTTEHLLPRLWPCKRIVATDKSRHMLDYARDHHQHPEVFFELLDIEHGDPQSIVDKHGWFDRVYAFLTFHYVSDLKRAYHNVHRLLKDGGECLVVYFTRTGITDAWYEVGRMDTWTNLIPHCARIEVLLPEVGSPLKIGRKTMSEHRQPRGCDLDSSAFLSLRLNRFRENIKALDSVKFKRRSTCQGQYLDLGCGPADFLAEHLLPRLRPCKRVVAVDISTEMLDYARKHHPQPDVFYEQLDIEHGDPQTITKKYGLFDRVYAFLTLHFVKDLKKAYRNVYNFLKEGGECLVLNFVSTSLTDSWQQVYKMETWTDIITDPGEVLSKRFRFNEPVLHEELEAEERRAIEAAGLELVSFRTYRSVWTFPTADVYLEIYLRFFKLEAEVPVEKRPAFRSDFMSSLLERLTPTSSGVGATYHVSVTHCCKPEAASMAAV